MINATSKIANEAFNLMKKSIKKFIDKHGDGNTKYQVVIHGDYSSPRQICSKSNINKELKRGTIKIPALHEDLTDAQSIFSSNLEKVTESGCY